MINNPINELAAALAKAQAEMPEAELDKQNPHFKSAYSSLAAVWRACRAPLSKHGLAVSQAVERDAEGALGLRTTLIHSSGQYLESVIPIIGDIGSMQKIGSAITYAKRYSLMAMVGVASDEDDDGNAAEPPRSMPRQDAEDRPSAVISDKQIGFLMAQCKGVGMPEDVLKEIVARHGFTSRKLITKAAFDAIIKEVQGWLK